MFYIIVLSHIGGSNSIPGSPPDPPPINKDPTANGNDKSHKSNNSQHYVVVQKDRNNCLLVNLYVQDNTLRLVGDREDQLDVLSVGLLTE